MDDAARVRGPQSLGDLPCDGQGLFDVHRAAVVEPLVQRLAVHEIHADEPAISVPRDVVDADHARTRYLSREQQFLPEALERRGTRGQLAAQQLQRDRYAQILVAGAVDHPHAAGADAPFDGEAIREPRAGREVHDRAGAGQRWVVAWKKSIAHAAPPPGGNAAAPGASAAWLRRAASQSVARSAKASSSSRSIRVIAAPGRRLST